MKNFLFCLSILILWFISSCNTKSKSISGKVQNDTSIIMMFENQKDYKFVNKQLFDVTNIKYEIKDGKIELNNLNEKQKQITTDQVKPLLDYVPKYNAYFYSIQNRIDSILPVVIYTTTGQSNCMYLITLGSSGVLRDYLRLSIYKCDVIDQDDFKEVIGCIRERSSFIKDGKIKVIRIKSKKYNYSDSIKYEIDSINLWYEIRNTGYIERVKKDSIHYKE